MSLKEISSTQIDSNILRINAIFYLILLFASMALHSTLLLLPIIIILLAKNFNIKTVCLIDRISFFISKRILKQKDKLIDIKRKNVDNIIMLIGMIILLMTNLFNLEIKYIPYGIMPLIFILEIILGTILASGLYYSF